MKTSAPTKPTKAGPTSAFKPIMLFVYGTLKRGFHNNRLLDPAGAEFICEATTANHFDMRCAGIPFLTEESTAKLQVKGEMWSITSEKVLANLDRLEGHPTWYCRKPLVIITSTGHVNAEAYFLVRKNDLADVRRHPCKAEFTRQSW